MSKKPELNLSFLEYPSICLCVDGTKDSTVMAHAVLKEAIPAGIRIKMLFVDEEAIYQETVDQVEYIMGLAPSYAEKLWIQSPFLLARDRVGREFMCWEAGIRTHMRPRTDFSKPAINLHHVISRVKEENPDTAFLFAKRQARCLKGWGTGSREHCPLWTWTSTQVWEWLFMNKLRFHDYYSFAYRKSIPIQKIEIPSLIRDYPYFAIQELKAFEPDTYRKLVRRCVDCGFEQNTKDVCEKLPERFREWKTYLHYLLDNHPNRSRALSYLRQPIESDKDAYYRTRRLVKEDYGGNLLRPRFRPEIEKARKLMERL